MQAYRKATTSEAPSTPQDICQGTGWELDMPRRERDSQSGPQPRRHGSSSPCHEPARARTADWRIWLGCFPVAQARRDRVESLPGCLASSAWAGYVNTPYERDKRWNDPYRSKREREIFEPCEETLERRRDFKPRQTSTLSSESHLLCHLPKVWLLLAQRQRR